MSLTYLRESRKGRGWFKFTLTRSHTRLKPAWREQGSTRWFHEGGDKYLVRRWHGEAGKFRILVQHKPPMTDQERAAWVSPSHLDKSRRFL